MDWLNLAVLILVPAGLVLAFWFTSKARQAVSQAETKVQSLETLVKDLIAKQRSIERQLQEVHAANHSLVGELERQSDVIEQTQLKQSQIQAQEPDSKLYTRAVKLVELGADVEEVMRECELPKAEAELLLSLRQKMKG